MRAGRGRRRARGASARSPTRRRRGPRAQAPNRTRSRAVWADAHDRPAARRGAAGAGSRRPLAGQAVHPEPARQREGPARGDLDADVHAARRRRRRPARGRAHAPGQRAHSPGLASRWTSTMNVRLPTIGNAFHGPARHAAARQLARAVAAHERQRGGAGDEAGGGHRRGLHGGQRGRELAPPAVPRPAPARPQPSPRPRRRSPSLLALSAVARLRPASGVSVGA